MCRSDRPGVEQVLRDLPLRRRADRSRFDRDAARCRRRPGRRGGGVRQRRDRRRLRVRAHRPTKSSTWCRSTVCRPPSRAPSRRQVAAIWARSPPEHLPGAVSDVGRRRTPAQFGSRHGGRRVHREGSRDTQRAAAREASGLDRPGRSVGVALGAGTQHLGVPVLVGAGGVLLPRPRVELVERRDAIAVGLGTRLNGSPNRSGGASCSSSHADWKTTYSTPTKSSRPPGRTSYMRASGSSRRPWRRPPVRR